MRPPLKSYVRASPTSGAQSLTSPDLQVLIDFGLTSNASFPEDRAVDLYVLERAFASTHPVPVLASGEEGVPHFNRVLAGYQRMMEERAKKGEWARIERRLEDVRGRGRKRSMIG